MKIELIDDKNTPYINDLVNLFNVNPEDAQEIVLRVPEDILKSLYSIKKDRFPAVIEVMHDLMEKVDGNVQMVEDILQYECMLRDVDAIFAKYRIAIYPSGRANSIADIKQGVSIRRIPSELIIDLVKPLRQKLIDAYQAKHPGVTPRIGRDLELFKKNIGFNGVSEIMPEFMFDDRGIIGRLPPLVVQPVFSSSSNLFADPAPALAGRSSNQNSAFTSLPEIIMIIFILGFLIHKLKIFSALKNCLFKPRPEVVPEETEDEQLEKQKLVIYSKSL